MEATTYDSISAGFPPGGLDPYRGGPAMRMVEQNLASLLSGATGP